MMGRVHLPSSSRLLLTLVIVAAFGLSAVGAWGQTCSVTSTADTNTAGTLRYCLSNLVTGTAANTNTITFTATGTITLTSALPTIAQGVTITGPGANQLTIDGISTYQAMDVFGSGISVGISGLTFANGKGGYGGAIYLEAGTLTVSDCVFSGNAAQNGGAIASDGTQLTVTGSTFTQNSAANHGGAIYNTAGTLTATNDTFYGNSAPGGGEGGAIDTAATANATNNTFYGNSSNYGGAIGVTGTGSLTSDNNLFAGNSASIGGAGIYNGNGGTANGDSNVYYQNLTNSSEDDCNSCTSNTNATTAPSNPLALPFGYYGGTTETYLPQPGSAAICAGSSSAPNLPGTDQRGFPVVNTCVDAGAVQSNYIEVYVGTDSNSATCPSTTKCSLRAAIAQAAGQGDIDFNSGVSSVTLSSTGTLTLALPASGAAGVNIIGPGAKALTVNGGGSTSNFSVFTVNASVPAVLYGLTISKGNVGGTGGGISNLGNLTLLSSAVTGNTSGTGGGGISSGSGSTLLVMDSTISGNTGSGLGGGIYSLGTMEMVESTVSDNPPIAFSLSMLGGGIYSGGNLTVVNSTIVGNSAGTNASPGSGGGIDVHSGSASLANTIVSGNTVGSGTGSNINTEVGGTYTDKGGNVVGGSTDATNTLVGGTGAAITLSDLGYNPSTASLQTQTPLPGSAAICAGLSTELPSGVYTDERGEPNENTTYSGYSANTPCVDAGAVQTNYSMSFTTSPSSVTVDQTFGGVVTLDESGNPFAGVDIPVTLSSGTLNGTATATTDSSGKATYSGLYTTNGSGLTLNASLPLTTAPLSLSATSSSFDVTAAPTTVALAPSTSSPTANQTVTFTATVSPNVTTNFVGAANVTAINGNVEFDDNGTAISGCSAQAVSYSSSSYVATCSTAALTGGAHSNITALFTPSDTNYQTSPKSSAVTVTVATASTTTALTSSSANDTSNVNDSVTFTATVTAAAGATVPLSGQVAFTDNSNPITSCGAVTVGSWDSTTGTATAVCTTSALTGGKHTIVATYSNDLSYTGSNNNLTQTVNAIATTTSASANPTTATLNESVALSATVTPNGQSVPLTGPVTFTESGIAVPGCTVTWDASTGAANCSTTQLAVGQHIITATYPADASYNTSSNSVTVNVGAATGNMSLAASPSTQTTVNQQVTFTASFTVQNGNTKPSGDIEFSYTPSGSTATDFSGCGAVGMSSTSNGNTKTYTATCSSSSLANGTYTITATYINDTNFSISPATLTQTVGPAPTTTQVTSSSSTSQVNQSVTFTATVSSQVSGSNTPSGTVSFTDTINNATTTLCSSVSVASGVYTCSTSSLVAGTHTITATFTPSNTDFKSSYGTVTQTVTAASSTIGLTAEPAAIIVKNPNNINDSATFTATVKVNGNSNKPAGDISFSYNGALPIPECPVAIPVDANGTATCTTTSLPAGLNTVNAAYSGDNNFKASNFSVSEAVQDYSIGINAVPTAGGSPETGTLKVTQGYTSSSDPFAPLAISVTPTTVQGFSGSLGLTCAVTVDSAPSGSVAPSCSLATSTLAVATSGTQQSADVVVDATKADPGLYTMTVTSADSTTGLAHTTSINIFVSATGGPLNIVSGSTTGNQAAVNFLLPANVSLSNLLCVSVSGTGIQPPGVPPSTLSISCSFDPTTIAAASAEQSGTVTVTVTTGGTSSTAANNSHMNNSHTKLWAAGLFGLPLFGLVGLLRGRKSARSVFFRVIAILALCTAAYQVTGCGGSFQKPASSGGQTPPGSYTMLIQGTGSDGHTYQAILRLNITL